MQIDELLEAFDESSQKRFLKKYNSDRPSQNNLLNELYIGNFLARTGISIEYDRNFDGKTPDWTFVQDGHPKCIVEVFTLNPIYKISKNQKVLNLLSIELKNLPGDRVIECEFRDNSAQHKIEKSLNRITESVKSWLNEETNNNILYPKTWPNPIIAPSVVPAPVTPTTNNGNKT